jgi:hypothetical protein
MQYLYVLLWTFVKLRIYIANKLSTRKKDFSIVHFTCCVIVWVTGNRFLQLKQWTLRKWRTFWIQQFEYQFNHLALILTHWEIALINIMSKISSVQQSNIIIKDAFNRGITSVFTKYLLLSWHAGWKISNRTWNTTDKNNLINPLGGSALPLTNKTVWHLTE